MDTASPRFLNAAKALFTWRSLACRANRACDLVLFERSLALAGGVRCPVTLVMLDAKAKPAGRDDGRRKTGRSQPFFGNRPHEA